MNKNWIPFRSIKISGSLIVLLLCSWNPIDFLQEIESKFDRFQKRYPSVKINMAFNQPVFSPGDTAFFKAFYTSEENIPISGNHIINVDLITGSGRTSQQIRFRIKDGSANNQIVLNKELVPGVYKLVAYTDWMKNFGESWYYQKKIQILQRNKVAIQEIPEYGIKFYSEGGHFVNGIKNNVAVVGPPLKELNIKNQQSVIIQKLKLDSTGIGSFMIIPESHQSYFAEEVHSKKPWPLPKADQDGIALQVDQKVENINLSIPKESKLRGQEIYVIGTASGKIIAKEKIVITQDQSEYSSRITAKTGVLNQIYVFDAKGNLIAHRVFSPVEQKNGLLIKMQFPSHVVQRENVSGVISILDKSGNPVESEATITVLQNNLFKEYDIADSYSSELPELTERIERYGKSLETDNDFLITQTWKRINWEAILSTRDIHLQFPFITRSTLKGQVVSNKTGFPPPDSTILLTYLQKNTVGYEAYVNHGKFEMPLIFDFWDEDYIFCSLQHDSKVLDDDYTISILKDSVRTSERWSTAEESEPSVFGEYSFKKKLVSHSFNYFGVVRDNNSSKSLNPNAILEEEFMGVDYSLNVSEYLIFPKMKDLLSEIVSYVQYRKKGEQELVRVFYRNSNTTKIFKENPLFIIDGLMSKDATYFLSLNPEDILFIKIINNPNKLAQLGKLGENGVIFVESRKGNLAPFSSVKNLFPIVGFNRSVDFSKNQTRSETSRVTRVPELNATLYWSPSIKPDSSGSCSVHFTTSDDVGPIKIIVRGITKDGLYYSAEQIVEVEFNSTKN